MKTFTCKEIMNGEGGCDAVFSGETAMDIVKQSAPHFMESADQAHKPMRDTMTTSHTKEEEAQWWKWFNAEWDKKKHTASKI